MTRLEKFDFFKQKKGEIGERTYSIELCYGPVEDAERQDV
jgi:hypothetical protein